MKAAIYSRKSKFSDKGESINNQIEICKEYIHRNYNKITDIQVYEDEGFSGGNTDRPMFQQMLQDAKNKKFDVLICYRLDRISRNIADFSNTLTILEKNNIDFISVREQFDTSTPMGRAMMYIASVFAQLERETIAERVRDNMLALSRTGRWLGGNAPMGFKSELITYYDEQMNQKKMYKLSPIHDELAIIKLIFDKYLEFRSLSKLETYLMNSSIKTKNDKFFSMNSLNLILKNLVYVKADENIYNWLKLNDIEICNRIDEFNGKNGLLVYNKTIRKANIFSEKDKSNWIAAIGKHKGIIDSKDWIEVQNIINKNKATPSRAHTSRYSVLSGMLVCGNCGSKMRVKRTDYKNPDAPFYFICTLKERSRLQQCNIKNIKGNGLEDEVIDILKKISADKNYFFDLLNINEKTVLKKINKEKNIRKELKEKIKKNEMQIENIVKQIREGSSAAKYLIEEIEKIDKENAALKKQLKDIDFEKSNGMDIESLIKNFSNFDLLINEADFEEKRKLLKEYINYLEWDGKELKINFVWEKGLE